MMQSNTNPARNEVLASQLVEYLAEIFGKYDVLPDLAKLLLDRPDWGLRIRHDDPADAQAITFAVNRGPDELKRHFEFAALWAAKNRAITATLAAIHEERDPDPHRLHNTPEFAEIIDWIGEAFNAIHCSLVGAKVA